MDLFSQFPIDPRETFPVHLYEKGQQSQHILNTNRKKFSKQCQILFDAMMRGERLSDVDCTIKYLIGDGRRRMKDLIDGGVLITKELQQSRYNLFSMTDEDKEFNKKFV